MEIKVLFTIYIPIDDVRWGGGAGGGRKERGCIPMYVIMNWHCGAGCVTDFRLLRFFNPSHYMLVMNMVV